MYPRDSLLFPYGESWKKGYAKALRNADQAPAQFTMGTGRTLQLHADERRKQRGVNLCLRARARRFIRPPSRAAAANRAECP